MNKRRDALRAMMTPIAVPPSSEDRSSPRANAAGSLKAMGLSLKSLSDDAEEARALRTQLASGAQVVELDPNRVDPSFVRDRLEEPKGEDFEAFKASLARDGQQIPILVRPQLGEQGRYQVAYGHRRLAALRALGRPVKAIVRNLTDEQLIVAQGKENTDRRDLSFIERALFAARLEGHGFSRAALISALSLQKGNLSTMIAIARSLPEALILAIGPAPKIGRPRWERLAELVGTDDSKWRKMVSHPDFSAADSDVRFEQVLKAFTNPVKARDTPEIVKTKDGKALASVQRDKSKVHLVIESRGDSTFGQWLVSELPEIYATFLRRVAT